MKKNVIIGIDFSKLTLDVTCFRFDSQEVKHYKQFDNTEEGCHELIEWLNHIFSNPNKWLVCGEYTGIYSMTAAAVFNQSEIDFWLENPKQIKMSSGIKREKSDKVDSVQIALYAARFMDRAKLYRPGSETILKIRELVRFKDRLTKLKVKLIVPSKELKRVRQDWQEACYIDAASKEIANSIDLKICETEQRMLKLLNTDPDLQRLYKLINSVVGVGMQTAIYLLIHTWGFNAFESPRQLACYCGLAPFGKQSGTSINGNPRISHLANKKLKSLLHMCALNAVKYDPFLKIYFERKISEGKHKMNVLNNVRNKLIHRICAVVNSEIPYDKHYQVKMTANAA